jgi:Bacterial extracellular solute-binding protein, family 7
MRRREFTKIALAAAAGAVAAPAIVKAETTFNWRMTSFYGPNAFFYSTGSGSAKDLCKRIEEMSAGRLKIQFYGAGELIPAAAGFDACSSGTVEMNYAKSYFWTGKVFAAQYFTAAPFGMNFVGFNGWIYAAGSTCGRKLTTSSTWCRSSPAIPACKWPAGSASRSKRSRISRASKCAFRAWPAACSASSASTRSCWRPATSSRHSSAA